MSTKFEEICLSVGYTFYKDYNERIVNANGSKKAFGMTDDNNYKIYCIYPTYDINHVHDYAIDGSHDIKFFISASGLNCGINLVLSEVLTCAQISNIINENKKLPKEAEISYTIPVHYFFNADQYDLNITFIKTKFNNLCVKSAQIKLPKTICDDWAKKFDNVRRQMSKLG